MAATPEQANEAMQHLSELQRRYNDGDPGLPPGAEWVNGAFDLLEQNDTFGDLDAVIAILDAAEYIVPPPPPPPATLREAMDIQDWWAGFTEFANRAHCGENPAFIDAVRYRTPDAQTIYDTFVSDAGRQQVNLNSDNRSALDELFGEGGQGGDHDAFAAAYEEVLAMSENDTWTKYMASLKQ